MPLSGIKKTIPDIRLSNMFESAVFCRPSDQAILDVETNRGLTFIELSVKVNKMARFLLKVTYDNPQYDSECCRRDGLLFAICMTPSTELIICLLAILKLEAAYVPVDVTFPTSRMEYILNDSKPSAILINGNIQNLTEAKIDQIKTIDFRETWSLVEEESCEAIHIESDIDDPLFSILYTSGSTGTPKGVKLGSNGVLNRVVWEWDTFPYGREEVVCFKTALTFVDSIREIYAALLTAHKLLILPKRMMTEVEDLVGLLKLHRVNRIILVPTLLRSILFHCSRTANESLPHLRLWFCSGEVFPSDLLEEFFRIFPNDEKELCNVYGCTEGQGDSAYSSFNRAIVKEGFPKNVPLGIPIYNSDVCLINNKMEEVTEGTIGEIMISGGNTCLGYLGMEKSEKFVRNTFNNGRDYEVLYKTGDYGTISNGLLYYQGRMDSQIKIRGHRVDLLEIQNCLQKIEGVANGYVLCYHPGKIEQMLLSFYIGRGSTPCIQKVLSKLQRQLPIYMIPQVYKIDDMPLLVSGKIDRQQLIQIYEKNKKDIQNKSRIRLGNCPNESKEIAEILLLSTIKALGPSAPDYISLDDNYFQIGGNSLNILLLLGYLQDVGYFIGIQNFITATTLRDVLSKITSSLDETQNIFGIEKPQDEKYKIRPIMIEDADDVASLLAHSFSEKSPLMIALGVTYDTVRNAFKSAFPFGDMPNAFGQLSFVLYDVETCEIIGAAINTDFKDGIQVKTNDWGLSMIQNFHRYCEEEAIVNFRGENVLHGFMLSTKSTIPSSENVKLVHMMEFKIVEIAKEHNYDSIITTNTNKMTQHLCQDVFNYTVLGTFQANLWIASDGSVPFKTVPDMFTVTMDAKYL